MIQANDFLRHMRQAGFGLFSGVPCSYLTPLINAVIDSPDTQYIGAANEGDAVAIACGAQLGGTRGVVMFQNSGLGNAVSPLTSLTHTFRLPVLVITTWRGQPGGAADEPQHELMGGITTQLLEMMGIPWELFPKSADDIGPVLRRAVAYMEDTGGTYALVMQNGVVADHVLLSRCRETSDTEPSSRSRETSDTELSRVRLPQPRRSAFPQDDVLSTIQANSRPTDLVLATTGFTGRALYALNDRPNQLYMVGSMGCVSSLGLGLARVQPNRRVIVIDGDGAALMRLGALATIGHERPDNLVHILLDNAAHDSTGTQATVSPTVDFAALAMSCGYPRALRLERLEQLADVLRGDDQSLQFIHVNTQPRDNRKLPRPTMTPAEVGRRFCQSMERSPCEMQLESVC